MIICYDCQGGGKRKKYLCEYQKLDSLSSVRQFRRILTVLFAAVAGLPVPFAPVHLLFINLLTDSLPAIALGLEPHSSEVMKEKRAL